MTHSLPSVLPGDAPQGVCAAPFLLPLPLPLLGPLPPAPADDEAAVRAVLFAGVPPSVPEADVPCNVECDAGVAVDAEDAACCSDSGRI